LEVEKLQREGRMPTLDQLLQVIGETRAEYGEKILAARKSRKGCESKKHSKVPPIPLA
jgi:hypothetical protein